MSRDRYLFYTACTRATRRLYLVREAATDDGAPREPSPFWEEVAAVFDPEDVARATQRRSLSALTWPLEAAPTERERLRALALLAVNDADEARRSRTRTTGSAGSSARARRSRETRLANAAVLGGSAPATFGVTELERFADCSSAWLLERIVDPQTIDAEADAMLRGSIAHRRCSSSTADSRGARHDASRRRTSTTRWSSSVAASTTRSRRRAARADRRPGGRADGDLWRDLEAFVRDEARSPLSRCRAVSRSPSARIARRPSSSAASGSPRDTLEREDRPDRRRPVQRARDRARLQVGADAHSAKQIDEELKLQIPLYMLVLRDLVGIEPLGGVYRALAGARVTRGLLRADAADDLPGFSGTTSRRRVLGARRDRRGARARVRARIRAGDVRHDPKGGKCPPGATSGRSAGWSGHER